MMSEQPAITAIAPWLGGKRILGPTIAEELGTHRSYFEPFCGSMAVLFAKPKCGQETVCDLHGDLTDLARVLASERAPELYDRLSRTLCSEALYKEAIAYAAAYRVPAVHVEIDEGLYKEAMATPVARAAGLHVPCTIEQVAAAEREIAEPAVDLPAALALPPTGPMVGIGSVERAYWFFILSWLGRNGTSGSVRQNFAMAVRWTPGGGSGGKRFVSAVESIPAWHQRLREVTILNRDAFEVIPRISDEEGVAIYVDPPYLKSTRTGKGGGSRYRYDFHEGDLFSPSDHVRLAEQLRRFKKARVVVSYYDDPRLAELYPAFRGNDPWWTVRRCDVNKQLHMQNKRGAKPVKAPEVLLINGPSYERKD